MKKGTEQEEQVAPLAASLHAWYAENHRVLPWRGITDAYRIWISEIILQQTRVAQGFEYYNRFISRFPDVRSLAAADDDEVMKLWQGLGYYSRARNLLTAARQVVERFGGEFPTTYEGIRSLQGIGDYTAAAVASFAYGLPHAVVDGNVYRVFPEFMVSIRLSTRPRDESCLPLLPTSCSTGKIRAGIIRR